MRLSKSDTEALIRIFSQFVKKDAELRLFGSRVDDNAKGGDIDILLILPSDKIRAAIAFQKAEILGQLKSELGEQKIDIIITTPKKIPESPFLESILLSSVMLKKWS